VTRSIDDGLTWGPSGGVIVPAKPGNPLNNGLYTRGSSLTVGPDHAIYVTVVTYNGSFKSQDIVISRSTDEGQSFGNAAVVAHLTSDNVPGRFGMSPNAFRYRAEVFTTDARNGNSLSAVGGIDLPLLGAPTKSPALTSITLAAAHCTSLRGLCQES
jgi:hypothetical protein